MDEDRYQFSLSTCGALIKEAKRWYCKKTSRRKVHIITRLNHSAPEQLFWERFIEVHIDGKMKSQTRITAEAYDTLTSDKSLATADYPGITITTIYLFTPQSK